MVSSAQLQHYQATESSIALTTKKCNHSRPCGCEGVATCCENCPLPRCKFDMELTPTQSTSQLSQSGRSMYNFPRDIEILKLLAADISPTRIARELGISTRTIYYILRKYTEVLGL